MYHPYSQGTPPPGAPRENAISSSEYLRRELASQNFHRELAAASYRRQAAQAASIAGALRYGAYATTPTALSIGPTTGRVSLYDTVARDSLMTRQPLLAEQQHSRQAEAAKFVEKQRQQREGRRKASESSSTAAMKPSKTHASIQREKRVASSSKASKASPKVQDIIEIDTSSDEDESTKSTTFGHKNTLKEDKQKKSHERKAPTEGAVSGPRKRLKALTSEGQPIVIVQNWSRESLVQELSANEIERVQNALQMILLHATGYTASTAPKNIPFPPATIEMSITHVHELAKEIVKEQKQYLKRVVDATFRKCAEMVEDLPKSSALSPTLAQASADNPIPGASVIRDSSDSVGSVLPHPPFPAKNVPVPTKDTDLSTNSDPLQPTVSQVSEGISLALQKRLSQAVKEKEKAIAGQRMEIDQLRKELEKAVEEKKKLIESYQGYVEDQIQRSKTSHIRSAKAYLKASLHSLRSIRQSMGGDSDVEDESSSQ